MVNYTISYSALLFDSFFPDWLGNAVARGTERAPDALAVSSDSRCLAFVGLSEYIVTIADSQSLDEVSRRCLFTTSYHL